MNLFEFLIAFIAAIISFYVVTQLMVNFNTWLKTPAHMTFQGTEHWHIYNQQKPVLPDYTMLEVEYEGYNGVFVTTNLMVRDIHEFDMLSNYGIIRFREINPR